MISRTWLDKHHVWEDITLALAWGITFYISMDTLIWIEGLEPAGMSDIQYAAALLIPSALDTIFIAFLTLIQKDYTANRRAMKLAGIEGASIEKNVTFKGTMKETD